MTEITRIIPQAHEKDSFVRSIALGYFNGVHEGHAQIIASAVTMARINGVRSSVQSFSNFSIKDNKEILTVDEKLDVLERMHADELVMIEFSKQLQDMSATDFLQNILVDKLNVKYISAGEDYTFGKGGQGDINLLKQFCADNQIELRVITTRTYGENTRKISTAWLIEALEESNIMLFSRLCGGRHYFCKGVVVHGKELGRTLDFPTANQIPSPQKMLPRRGVYASRVSVDGQIYYAVSNVGLRPTVEDDSKEIIESYIFDYNKNCYGKEIKTELIAFLRPEIRFDSVYELAVAVENDKRTAAGIFGLDFT